MTLKGRKDLFSKRQLLLRRIECFCPQCILTSARDEGRSNPCSNQLIRGGGQALSSKDSKCRVWQASMLEGVHGLPQPHWSDRLVLNCGDNSLTVVGTALFTLKTTVVSNMGEKFTFKHGFMDVVTL